MLNYLRIEYRTLICAIYILDCLFYKIFDPDAIFFSLQRNINLCKSIVLIVPKRFIRTIVRNRGSKTKNPIYRACAPKSI